MLGLAAVLVPLDLILLGADGIELMESVPELGGQ